MQCPFCDSDGVPEGAHFCPYCQQRFYAVAGTDLTPLIAEHTRAFSGRGWVFQAIDQWLADPEGLRLFLLCGGPGTGKSAIAARLVQLIEDQTAGELTPHLGQPGLSFYHFCEAFNDPTLDPMRFVKRLSLHMAASYPAFAQALTQVEARDPEIHVRQQIREAAPGAVVAGVVIQNLHLGNLTAREAFDRVVRQPLEQLCTPDVQGTILIVVDALDAALAYPGESIVDVLGETTDHPQDLPHQVRLLVTSRPDDRIEHLLGRPALDLDRDAPAGVDDVRAYAMQRLQALSEPGRSALAERISRAGSGNFLYVRCVLDDMPDDLARLDDPATLPLPHDLHDVYRRFLRRELARSLETWDQVYAPQLAVLAVARGEGLTREQLAAVTGQSQPAIRRLMSACGQYLSGPRPDGPFRVFHRSFRDFLLQDDEIQVDQVAADRAIAGHYWQLRDDHWKGCDGYGLHYLPTHLAAAGWTSRLRELLLDAWWLRSKLGASGVTGVLADYELLADDTDLRLVRDALRLSAHVLADGVAHLPCQLHGRLLGRPEPAIQHLLAQLVTVACNAWLRPLLPSLDGPGGPLVRTLAGHSGGVNAVVVTPDGRHLLSASRDRSLRLWRLDTGVLLRTLTGHRGPVEAVDVTPDGRMALSTSYDGNVRLWDLETGRERESPLREQVQARGSATAISVSPDGRLVLCGLEDGRLVLWDLAAGTDGRVMEGHAEGVRQVVISQHGRLAVSASNDQTLKVWDLASGRVEHTLRGHGGPVTAVALTPDGQQAVSASNDHTLKVWDLTTGRLRRTLLGHSLRVLSVAVHPDGDHALSASADRTLKVWDLTTGRCMQTLAGHTNWVQSVTVTPDGRNAVSASYDRTLKIWDLEVGRPGTTTISGRTVRATTGHEAAVSALVAGPDGRWAISASYDHTLKVWDLPALSAGRVPAAQTPAIHLEAGHEPRTLQGHTDWVQAVAVTPSGQHALSASHDRSLKLWFLRNGTLLNTLRGHSDAVRAVAIVPGGRYAVSGSYDRTLIVWDLSRAEAIQTLEGHGAEVMVVAVSPDGLRAVSGSHDRTLRVWDLSPLTGAGGQDSHRLSAKPVHTLRGHAAEISAVAITPDGQRAVSASLDYTLKIWDLVSGQPINTLAGHTNGVSSVAIGPGGTLAVSASHDRTVRVWDLDSGEEKDCLAGHASSVRAVTVSRGGRLAISASMDGTLRVWDLAAMHRDRQPAGTRHSVGQDDRQPITTFQAEDSLSTVAIAPDGVSVLAGDSTGRVHVLRLEELDRLGIPGP